jgi:hypothetical protein
MSQRSPPISCKRALVTTERLAWRTDRTAERVRADDESANILIYVQMRASTN